MHGDNVSFEGKTISVNNVQIEVVPVRKHIPLYLGVTGPKALSLCGEIADGVMLNAFLPTNYVVRALGRIEEAAIRAGKNPNEVDIAGALVVSVDEDSRLAKDRVRPLIALYLAMFPNIAQETELEDELILETRQAFQIEGIDKAALKISDEIVNHLTVAGTPNECKNRIAAYREVGLQLPLLFPIEDCISYALETLRP